MTEKKIDLEQVQKSLDALKDSVVKGHGSRGTTATEVPAMAGESGSTQVFHTASNSDPGTWAGTGQRAAGQDDAISENGTDYDGGAEVVKSILDKVQKGQALSGAEKLVLSMMAKGAFPGKEEEEEEDEMDKGMDADEMDKAVDVDEDDMDKSLEARARENSTLKKGFEVSDFLHEFVSEVSKSMAANQKAVCRYIDQRLAEAGKADGEFRKSLVGAVSSIGDVSLETNARLAQLEQGPARAPRSVDALRNMQAIEKGGFQGGSDNLSKSQVNDILVDAVINKGLSPQVQLRFDATGELNSETRAIVDEAIAKRR